jgi:GntR family transcriptional repressor for pyruvate dehydrogenase complex
VIREMFLPEILLYIGGEDFEEYDESGAAKLPSMDELCRGMGVSKGKLREQLIAAQALGVVDMRPGDGTYVLPFDFYTPTRTLVLYAISRNRSNFDRYYELRVQLEAAFWDEAARRLTQKDKEALQKVIHQAQERLGGERAELPHSEHRDFHMLIFSKLDNEFVLGLLRSYWDAYETVGLHIYFDYDYYREMWASHQAILDAIVADEYEKGKEILVQHFSLLGDRLEEGF